MQIVSPEAGRRPRFYRYSPCCVEQLPSWLRDFIRQFL